MTTSRRQFLHRSAALAAAMAATPLVQASVGAAAANSDGIVKDQPKRCWRNSHFVMDNWFYGTKLKPTQQAKLAKDLGYSGMTISMSKQWQQIPGYVSALDAQQLSIVGVTDGWWIEKKLPARFDKQLEAIKGRDTWLMLQLRSNKFQRGDKRGNAIATDLLKRFSDLCDRKELAGVAIYPYAGNWLQTVSHGVRVCDAVARPNVGLMFNQYHWMRTEKSIPINTLIGNAIKHLKCVSVNGSNTRKPDVRPLGDGNFAVLSILQQLAARKYHGEVGTFGHGIKGDVGAKLKGSMKAWEKIVANCTAKKASIARPRVPSA